VIGKIIADTDTESDPPLTRLRDKISAVLENCSSCVIYRASRFYPLHGIVKYACEW
jgi:hypothetical protein